MKIKISDKIVPFTMSIAFFLSIILISFCYLNIDEMVNLSFSDHVSPHSGILVKILDFMQDYVFSHQPNKNIQPSFLIVTFGVLLGGVLAWVSMADCLHVSERWRMVLGIPYFAGILLGIVAWWATGISFDSTADASRANRKNQFQDIGSIANLLQSLILDNL